jgi:HAE1 family hydrophobic/amphiphilic exporter-1
MTSIAFILGVLPLVFAEGAGAASRQSLGTAVFGGMVTSTVLAVFFVPAFYVAVQRFAELWGPPRGMREHAEHVAESMNGETASVGSGLESRL